MPLARLNIRFVLALLGAAALLTVLVLVVHHFQLGRHGTGQLTLADEAEQQGRIEDAIAALGRYLEFRPDDAAVRVRLGLFLASTATTRSARLRALQVLNQGLTRVPRHYKARVKAAELAAELGEMSEALRHVAAILASRPRDADALALRARLLEEEGQFVQAAEALEKALEFQPQRIAEAVELAWLLHDRLRNPQQARRVLDRMVAENHASPASLLQRARFLARHGHPVEALADLKAGIEKAPQNVDLRLAWGELAGNQGQWQTAREQYAEAVKLAPDRPETALGLAWILREKGQRDEANAVLEAGLQRLPNQPGLVLALAEVRAEQGRLSEVTELRERLPKEANSARLYLDGLTLIQQQKWSAAAEALTEAVRLRTLPAGIASKALLGLCRAYLALEAPEERLVAARHAQTLADTPTTRLERATAALAVGLADEAVEQLRPLLARPNRPEGTPLLFARALLEHNLTLPGWQRRWLEVEEALDHIVEDDKTAVPLTLLRARMWEAREQPNKARALLKTQLKKGIDHAAAWLALAEMETRLGNYDAADKALRDADGLYGGTLGWLLLRAGQLAGRSDRTAQRELQALEHKATDLGEEALTRFQWHLLALHVRAGRIAAVERMATSLLRRDPQNLVLQLMVTEGRIFDGDEEAAREGIAQLKQAEGEKGAYWNIAEAQRLLHQVQKGEREQENAARDRIKQTLAVAPNWPKPWLVLGRLERAVGQPQAALAAYRGALARGDWGAEAVNQTLQLLLAADRHRDADELIERAQRRGAWSADLLRPAAFIALQAGRTERARELARQAVPPDSRSYRDLVWLGRILDKAGQPAEAEAVLRDALALAPEAPEPWLALARVQKRARRPEAAQRTLEEMEEKLPTARRLLAAARGHEVMGRLREAETAFRAFLKSQPRDPEAQRRLIALLMRTNQPEAAEVALREALDEKAHLQPEERPELVRQLVLALTAPQRQRPQIEEALKLLQHLREREGDTETNRRTEALVRGASPSQQKTALEELAGLMAGPTVLTEERARLAHLLEQAGEWSAAREVYLALVRDDPDNPTYLIELIKGLLRQGRKPEAEEWLKRLQELDGEHPRLPELQKETRDK